MVVTNSHSKDIQIRHVIDIRNSSYIVVTAYQHSNSRTKCYLLDCQRGEIYSREHNHWNQVNDPFDHFEIQRLIRKALSDERVPKFSTDSSGLTSVLN
jgi:hypothetical protein